MKRIVACCIFHTPDKKLLLQDREGVSKIGEKWGFFGGGVEPGETPDEAVVREIKEELDFDLTGHTFFKHLTFTGDDRVVDGHYYLKQIDNLSQFTQQEGEDMKLFTLSEAKQLK